MFFLQESAYDATVVPLGILQNWIHVSVFIFTR